ncbi:phage tail protein [Nakamurella sp.]|uniref:phage tail protein n=1 Tax=Nakamurella sp. TaxID=1869182 RepID=UPI003B3AA057
MPEATAGGETQVSAEDAKRIQTAVRALPTTDPALDVDAGPVPVLELAGGEDPQQIEDQATSVEEATTGAQRDGLADARADMGENDVFPQIPAERLTADIGTSAGATTAAPAGAAPAAAQTPAGSGATGGAGQGAGGPGGPGPDTGGRVPAAAIDAVVAEQSTDQIAAATREQGAALGAARTDHDTSVEQARTDTDKAINDEITANGGEQTQARRDVRGAVGRERRDWVGEQDRAAGDSRTAAGKAAEQARGGIGEARSKARTDAGAAILDGNENITKERSKAEKSAREEREKAEKESDDGGFFSWLGSKIRSFVNRIKSAIHAVFELARKAVDAVISAAQKLAVAAIEIGRRAVVAAIDLAGKALIAAGDIVLAAFPEARDRFRAKIKEKVDGAKEAVNELADKLKAGVTKLLDALGGLLKGALTLLEKAYTAAIDAVGKVIDSAIKAARVFVDALLDFAALIADIASDPIQWIKNLGAGLLDGVRNHVWGALVGAVKTWFKEKVEEIIGLGRVILDVLRKGGITFTRIVSMAWTAIKESLPGIVIQLLIEKLVAMLIPAGGAIALIIDGIKAAWGAASKILAAFGKFMAFLKAVKSGRSGPLFGDLVGAAAVAVLDFVANWVLSKLKGPGQKVGGALQKMAKRIMTAIKKVAKVVKAGAKAAAGAIRRGAKAVVGLVKRGAAAAGRVVRRVMPRNVLALGRKAVAKVRATVRRGIAKAKAGYTRAEERLFGKPKPKETSQQRLARIVGIIGPQIQGWFDRGVGRFGLIARLTGLRLRHRLRALKPEWAGQRVVVRARVNPEAQAAVAWSPGSELRRLVGEVAAELLRDPEVVRAARAAQAQAEAGQPVLVQSGPQYLGAASATHGRVDRQQTSFLVGQHQPVRRGSSEQTGTPFTATPAPLKGRSAEVFEGQQKMRSDSREGGSTSDVAQLSAGDAGKILALQQHQVVAGHENYLDVSEGLGDLAQRATGDRDSGPAMLESFVRTGSASLSRKPERKRLGRFAGLLGVVETARDPAHAADLAMATDLVGQKRGRLSAVLGGHPDDPITAADLFTRPSPAGERERGGILPMTHTGAQRAAFDVSVSDAMADVDRLDAPGPAGSNQPSRPNLEHARNDQERTAMSFAHRRMLLAERWVELKMQADPEAFKDRESAAIAIENRLRQYFGLALKTPGGQLPGGGS